MKIHKANNRIIFYRNKEKPGYYLLYSGRYSYNTEKMEQILNHTGEYTDSGYEQVNVALAYVLETNEAKEFLDFITKHISSDYIEHRFYSGGVFSAWCKLESFKPEQWKEEFELFKKQKINGSSKKLPEKMQMALF